MTYCVNTYMFYIFFFRERNAPLKSVKCMFQIEYLFEGKLNSGHMKITI